MQKTLFLALLLVLLAAPGNALAFTKPLTPLAFTDKVAMLIWEPLFARLSKFIGPKLCHRITDFIAETLEETDVIDTSYCETAITEYAAYIFFPGTTREEDDYNFSWNTDYVRKW